MLYIDYRTSSSEGTLVTHSHLLPMQPSRALSLLPSLLDATCAQTRWVTPSIIDRGNCFCLYKPGETGLLQVLSMSGDAANHI